MQLNHKEIIRLYEKGLSTRQVSLQLGYKKGSVLDYLRKQNLLRRTRGLDIEKEVGEWFRARNNTVKRMRGDWPFDYYINNLRYDVKSSSIGKDKKYNTYSYRFTLANNNLRKKDKIYHEYFDYFLLVFLDESFIPLYRLSTKTKNLPKSTLGISHLDNTKYPIEFIGFLRDGGAGTHHGESQSAILHMTDRPTEL